MHGVAIVKENDFLESVCEEIKKDSMGILFFCAMKTGSIFFFPPYKHNLEVSSSLPLAKEKHKCVKKVQIATPSTTSKFMCLHKIFEGL